MKSIKLFFLATLALVAAGFAACSDDDFKPGPGVDGAQVYFPETIPDQINLEEEASSFTIPVKRISTEGALSIAIMSEDESGLFNIPSTVDFTAGQESADLVITYDKTKIDGDKEYPIALLLNDEKNTTPYGNSSLHVTVAVWPWVLMEANEGKGKYREDFFSGMFSGLPNPEVEVKIYQHKSKQGIYMVEDMFGWNVLTETLGDSQEALEAEVCTYNPTNITIDASNPNQVVIPTQQTGIVMKMDNYGKLAIMTAKFGTLSEGVITFPVQGILMNVESVHDATHGSPANRGGMFRIILPGYEAVDYSLTATYDGMKVSADGETTSAVIDFGYGADVTGISYVFASGDVTKEADQYAAKIADGTAENIAEVSDFVQGAGSVSIEAELTDAGNYTIIAVPHDSSTKPRAKEVAATTFYFPGLGGNDNPVEIAAALYKVSEYPDAAAYVTQCPDYSSILYEISGTDITSVKTYMNKTSVIANAPALGLTLQQIMDQYGRALAAADVAELNQTGKHWNIFINLNPDESYTLLVEASNSFGKKKLISTQPFSTAGVPYAGDLVLGQYTMSYTTQGVTFNNLFKLKATMNSLTDFQVVDFALDGDGSVWKAAYDQNANTLTLSGVKVGEEARGNLFGKITTYYDADNSSAYGFFSFAGEGSKGDDPCVITIDPSSKQLSALQTEIEVPLLEVLDDNGNLGDVIDILGLYYSDGTKIAPHNGSASSFAAPQVRQARQARLLSKRVNIPFSSVRIPMANRFESIATFGRRASDFTASNGLRTLSVKSAKCEPLPKQRSLRPLESVTFQAVK